MSDAIGFDSHCHLTIIAKNKKEIDEFFTRAAINHIGFVIDIGLTPDDIDERMRLLGDVPRVTLAAGYYPDYADSATEEGILAYEKKIQEINKDAPRIRLIGEIGLDYFHNGENKKSQMRFFERMLGLAKRLNLPVSIHTRDAWEDMFLLLEQSGIKKGALHCFTGTVADMERAVNLGFHVSFAGNVSYTRSDELREAAKRIPKDRYLIETDAPYLSHKKVRGRRNEPAFLLFTAETVAEARGISVEDALRETADNARALIER